MVMETDLSRLSEFMSVEILSDKCHKTYETPSDNAHRFTASSITRNDMQVAYLINLILFSLGGAGLKNKNLASSDNLEETVR